MNQLQLFEAETLLEGEALLEYKAKLYTVKQFIHSCSNRGLIRNAIENGEKEEARKWVIDTCRTFGLGSSKGYTFNGYSGKVIISYHDKEGKKQEFSCTYNHLFNFLLENYKEAKQSKTE